MLQKNRTMNYLTSDLCQSDSTEAFIKHISHPYSFNIYRRFTPIKLYKKFHFNMSKEEFIIPRTLLSKEPKNVSEDVNYNTDLYKNLQNWSVPILKSPDHKYVFNKVEDLPPPLIVQYNNEFNLSDEDTSTLKNKIEKSYIEKFVELKKEEFNSNILFDVSNVYSVTDYRPEPLPKVEIPETYNNLSLIHI